MQFTHVFASDLDRATDTAQTICQYQLGAGAARLAPVQTHLLRERQVGPVERQRRGKGAIEEESLEEMQARTSSFVNDYIRPLLPAGDGTSSGGGGGAAVDGEEVVAVVSHGGILQILWVSLEDLFDQGSIRFRRGLSPADFEDSMAPVWSNTGVLELDIKPKSRADSMSATTAAAAAAAAASGPPLAGWTMTILSVDSTAHLAAKQAGPGMTGAGAVKRATMPGTRGTTDEFYRITGTV